jgi:hypothetical protein
MCAEEINSRGGIQERALRLEGFIVPSKERTQI